jgi:hypothetical protein
MPKLALGMNKRALPVIPGPNSVIPGLTGDPEKWLCRQMVVSYKFISFIVLSCFQMALFHPFLFFLPSGHTRINIRRST